MESVHINGAEGIALVAQQVRALGTDRTIVNEMAKEIRSAVPPARAAIKESATTRLPRRGGLGAWVARASITARIRRSANNAGVSLVVGRNSAKARTDMAGINEGVVRHPAWGNRRAWVAQRVTPGFVDQAVEHEGLDAFEQAVIRAVDTAAGRVLGGS